MKKIITLTILAAIASLSALHAFDLKGALKGLGKDGNTTIDGLANVIGDVLSTDKIDVASISGTWSYKEPAVSFKSDNLLKKAGGAAAATAIAEKLAPVYKLSGIDKLTFTIDESGNFQMKMRGVTLKGVIEPNTDENDLSNFTFKFQAAGKSLGAVNAYVVKSIDSSIKLTFDITKLVDIIGKASKVIGNSTLKTLSGVLSSYDGLCAGFELTKQK